MRLEFESKTSASPHVAGETVNDSQSSEADQILRDGVRAAQEGRRSEAKAMLLRATEIDPRNESAWLWLASISEYPEELLAFLNNVLEINASNERAVEWKKATESLLSKTLVQRGVDATRDNRQNFARQCFEQAVEHDSNNEMAWLWLASICDSDAEKAGMFERVLAINPENETARESLEALRSVRVESVLADALSQAVDGHHEAARQLIDIVVDEDPDSEIAWELRAHLSHGFEDRAESLLRLRSLNPENEFAKASLASWRRMVERAPVSVAEPAEPVGDESLSADPQSALVFPTEYAAPDSPTQDLGAVAPETAEPSGEAADTPENAATEGGRPDELAMLAAELEAEESEMSLAFADCAESAELSEPEGWYPESRPEAVEYENPEPAAFDDAGTATDPYAEFREPVGGAPAEGGAGSAYDDEDRTEEWRNTSPDVFVGYSPNPADAQEDPSRNGHDEAPTEMFVQPVSEADRSFERQMPSADETPAFGSSPEPATVAGAGFGWSPEPDPAAETAAFTWSPEPAVADPSPEQASFQESAPRAEMSLCPFCNFENEKQAHSCGKCRAVLGLTDLDLLLGNQDADEEILKQAVESLEREHEGYGLSAEALAQLGVGQINLKNHRQGLAYLQEAVQMNPSNVVLDAQVNAFAIRLAEMEKQAAAHDSMAKNRKILVVDDSPTVRKLIASKLEKCGHEVHCAVDGLDALEKLNSLVPDLILLDITMPRMDGYQVCKLIRNNADTREVPVVMISGKDGFFDKVRGRMAGTTDYITKPFGPETLMRTVESYLS